VPSCNDVGKIGIPDKILLKPAALTSEERAVIETHPGIGDQMLAPLDLLEPVRPIVRHHHERWDGRGYPDGLAGESIRCSPASSRSPTRSRRCRDSGPTARRWGANR